MLVALAACGPQGQPQAPDQQCCRAGGSCAGRPAGAKNNDLPLPHLNLERQAGFPMTGLLLPNLGDQSIRRARKPLGRWSSISER